MKVYKFGGASVKDVAGVKNISKIITTKAKEETIVVVSAMGKMTNAFEKVAKAYYEKATDLSVYLDEVMDFHYAIAKGLFEEDTQDICASIDGLFASLQGFMIQNRSRNYNYVYDQIVSYGELLSTTIVSKYLSEIGVKNQWYDVRALIKTDSTYRDAKVDWEQTSNRIHKAVNIKDLSITQGFLGGDGNNGTTTLGREGSDYSAAIFAYVLHAKSVTIWKDVPGVLNADPRKFEETVLLERISYMEAIEMAFYGASVIHPKTLKPLENKLIPLYVNSFLAPEVQGTKVEKRTSIMPEVPCFIVKNDQILLSITTKDFSFIEEDTVSDIFNSLAKYKLKVNLMQNSALSFSLCVQDYFGNFSSFLTLMQSHYKVTYNKNVRLYTVRHVTKKAIETLESNGELLLEQRSRSTVQMVIK